MSKPTCVLIATGGTIACRIDPASGLAFPVATGTELLAAVPHATAAAEVEVEEFDRISSPHITPEDWLRLQPRVAAALARPDVAGVVITHGTGTLEETAWFLDLTLRSDKPVVITGAQRNASEADTDGNRNLSDAIRLAVAPAARGMGVLVALNGHVNAAREATKAHSLDVETFQSGEWGYLGNILPDRIVMQRAPLRRLHVPLTASHLSRVEIITMYGGTGDELVRHAMTYAHGIVVQAIGTGHVNPPVARALKDAVAAGIAVVTTSRIPRGGTKPGYGMEGSSRRLADAGVVLGNDLSPWKARILLMLALQTPRDSAALQALFDT